MEFSDIEIIIFPIVFFYEQMPDTGRCNRYSTVGFTTASRMSQHRSPCFSALNLNILGVCFYCAGPCYNRMVKINIVPTHQNGLKSYVLIKRS